MVASWAVLPRIVLAIIVRMTSPAFQVTGLAAVLYVKDMPAALAYYRDTLGFTVKFTWRDPPQYVCLGLGDASVHLSTYAPVAKSIVCIFCMGVDALHDQLAAHGANITQPIKDEPYGMREFEVCDPDGHRLVFGQSLSH
jgi:uncharacterized glyoxalase superfamily protein PhnB